MSDVIGVPFDDFVGDKVAVKERQYNTRMNADQDEGMKEALRDDADEYRKQSDGA